MPKLQPEFTKRNCKIMGLSVDTVASHKKWIADIEVVQGSALHYPMSTGRTFDEVNS